MKFLFLDVDGVLNDHLILPASGVCTIHPRCVEQFNRILVAVPRLGVVLSSAWRYMILGGAMTLAGFKYLLATHGVDRERLDLVGYTVSDEEVPGRGKQISAWLSGYWPMPELGHGAKVESYAILDDGPPRMDFTPVAERLVKTNGKIGLTAADADRVIAMLGRE